MEMEILIEELIHEIQIANRLLSLNAAISGAEVFGIDYVNFEGRVVRYYSDIIPIIDEIRQKTFKSRFS